MTRIALALGLLVALAACSTPSDPMGFAKADAPIHTADDIEVSSVMHGFSF